MAAAPHCIDQADMLEVVRVDLGGPADHVARRCATDLISRCRIREFLMLLAETCFRLEVITSTTGKPPAVSHTDSSWRSLKVASVASVSASLPDRQVARGCPTSCSSNHDELPSVLSTSALSDARSDAGLVQLIPPFPNA